MSVKRIKNLVKQLNEYRHAYYNQDAPLVSDAEYDRLFDELKELEEQTGFILSNSPTQTVGYYPVSELAKVTHPTPLLSLEKTKLISELLDFMKGQEVLFMLKLDGLTTKLIYEDGKLIQASTRGDGEVGEDITHNIPAFLNVPLTIPHKERLVITGESFIPTNDFERLKDTLRDGNGKPYKNGRNFASGSVRSLDPKNCIGRCVRFLPFNVLEGMEDVPFPDSRACKLEGLTHLGFGYCPFFSISGTGLSREYAEKFIQELVSTAANLHLPIDGIVMIFDSLSYSKSCGKTGHHYKDGSDSIKIVQNKDAMYTQIMYDKKDDMKEEAQSWQKVRNMISSLRRTQSGIVWIIRNSHSRKRLKIWESVILRSKHGSGQPRNMKAVCQQEDPAIIPVMRQKRSLVSNES